MLDKVLEGFGRPTEELIAAYESKQGTAADTETRDTLHAMPTKQPAASHRGLSIFISHSSKDADLALALIDLLKAGLGLMADQIRCSSVDGYRLPVGVNTEGKLREEVNAAKVVVGLITLSSLSSYYVMFELGARWGANLFLAPLLAGVKGSELSGPLSLLNALSASSEAQLHQLLADIANHIGLRAQPAASYLRNVSAVKALADAVANPTAAWDIGEKTNHLHKEHRGKEQVLSAMTPHQNVRRSEVAKLLKMSEDEVLQALRVLREEDKVISLDVDEEPKETFWTRI